VGQAQIEQVFLAVTSKAEENTSKSGSKKSKGDSIVISRKDDTFKEIEGVA
jgi:hypothetical protein